MQIYAVTYLIDFLVCNIFYHQVTDVDSRHSSREGNRLSSRIESSDTDDDDDDDIEAERLPATEPLTRPNRSSVSSPQQGVPIGIAANPTAEVRQRRKHIINHIY